MATNFGDPTQVAEFKEIALSRGKDPDRVNRFIRRKRKEAQAISAVESGFIKPSAAIEEFGFGITPKLKAPAGFGLSAEEEKQALNLRTLESSVGLLTENLSQIKGRGPITGPIGTKVAQITGGALGIEFADFAALKDALVAPVARVISTEVGRLTDQDIERAEKLLPSASDTPALAIKKLRNIARLINDKKAILGIEELPSAPPALMQEQEEALPPAPPALAGEIERGPKGELRLAGTPEDLIKELTGGARFVDKNTPGGGKVEGGLIQFLADSEFLPIAGSIVGGLAGAGVATLATGAAGAVAGKTLQQGLRELLDPDRQDLSDAARSIVTEGIVDAVFGGVFLGIGKGASLILKKTFGRGAQELTEAGAKLVRKGLPIPPTKLTGFKRAFGVDFAQEVIERGIPKTTREALETGTKGLQKANQKLGRLLKGKTAKTSEVIDILKAAKPEKVPPNLRTGVAQIDEWIKFVKGFGDEIPASELNKVKRGLQESFGRSLEVTTGSKRLVTRTSSKVRKFIEDLHPEIKGTNKEIRFNQLLRGAGEKAVTTEKMKSLFRLSDIIFIPGGRIDLLVAKKAIEAVTGNPLQQARIIQRAAEIARATGDRGMLRGIIKLAMRLGITFSAHFARPEGLPSIETTEATLPAQPPQLPLSP